MSGFQRGNIFLSGDNTELKRCSKINFTVSERYRWAVVGEELVIPSNWTRQNESAEYIR